MPSRPDNYGTLDYIEEMDRILDELTVIRRGLGRYDRKERFTPNIEKSSHVKQCDFNDKNLK